MSSIKLVVFDMAGTTVKDENEVEKCFIAAAEASSLPYEKDEIISMMGWSKIQVFETLWNKALPNEQPAILQEKISYSYTMFTEILENHYSTQPVKPVEGCLDIFNWLKEQGVAIGLTTGFYRKVTNIILERLGWDKGLDNNYKGSGLINVSVCSDEVEKGRPAPDMIYKCMESCGITDPEEVVNIGDTPSDLASGTAAGCLYSLGVTNGTHTKEQLMACTYHALFPSIVDLKDFL